MTPFADLYTIWAYFHTGNTSWGVVSLVFVAIGWLMQACWGMAAVSYGGLGETHHGVVYGCLGSRRMRREWDPDTPLFKYLPPVVSVTLGMLHLGPVVLIVDRLRWGPHRLQLPDSDRMFKWSRLADLVMKSLPTLMLHCYILIVNQFAAGYAGRRLEGLDLAAQVTSVVGSIVLFGATAGVPMRNSKDPELYLEDFPVDIPLCNPSLFAVTLTVDLAVHCLRVALLAAAVHLWVLAGVAGGVVVVYIFGLCSTEAPPVERSLEGTGAVRAKDRCLVACLAVTEPLLSCAHLYFYFVDAPSLWMLLSDGVVVSTGFIALAVAVPWAFGDVSRISGVCTSWEHAQTNSCVPPELVIGAGVLVLGLWALLVLISRDARQPHRVQPALLQEGRRSGPWHDVAGVLRAMHGSKDVMTHVTAIYTLYVVCYRCQWALLSDSAHGVQLARGLLASLGRFPGSAAVQASACWVLKSSYRLRDVAAQEGALRHVAAAVLAHAGNTYVVVHAFELLLDLVKEYVVRAQFRSAHHGGADALAFLTEFQRRAYDACENCHSCGNCEYPDHQPGCFLTKEYPALRRRAIATLATTYRPLLGALAQLPSTAVHV